MEGPSAQFVAKTLRKTLRFDREEDRRSWGLLARTFSRATAEKSKKKYKTKKGDISIEVRKGTFLKSFDKKHFDSLTQAEHAS